MDLDTRRLIGYGRAIVLLLLALAIGLLPTGAALAQQPQKGGTFIIAMEGEPPILNPYINTETTTLNPSINVYNFLIGIDQKLNPRPDLAESWTITDEGKTYTFKLVKNATWHDGKPFTSADVVYTLKEIAPKHPRAGVWWTPNVASVEAPDEYTVVIKLKGPFAPFMAAMSFPGVAPFIVAKHIFEGTDLKTNPTNNAPVGTGPFKFKEWAKGQHIELVRNEKYFKKDLPYFDRLIVRFLPDTAARTLAFEKGEVDFLHYYIAPTNWAAEMKKRSDVVVDERGGEGAAVVEYVLLNTRHPILAKREVRQAIATALNKEEIRNKSVSGLGKTSDSVMHSGMAWGFNPNVPKYPYNVEKANQMLDAAGHPKGADGVRFKLGLSWATGRDYEGLSAEVIRDQLRAVGIQVDIKTLDRATFIDQVYMNWNFDMAHQLIATGPDPTIGLTRLLHTNQIKKASFVNAAGYSNPEADKLLDLEFKQTDVKQRGQTWGKIQEMVATDVPIIPLYELPVANVYHAKVKNLLNSAHGQYENHEQAWMGAATQPTAAPAAAKPQATAASPAAAQQQPAATDGGATGLIIGGIVVVVVLAGGFLVLRRRT